MKLELHRGEPCARETRHLPAELYNLAHTLLARASSPLFVPIRSMQVLAVLDAEEFVFVDGVRRNRIEIAWREFAPRARSALDAPVPYLMVRYTPESGRLLARLQSEFGAALRQIEARSGPVGNPADVLPFTPRGD